ncbi:hypothetical protein NM688_g7248 [Phlebia brevispora]|uniref:Uncharacterized protein n=1 Tax=Phlebia brevispora TaxID=194682 RepID=A0ACC1S7G0_9APHY|nr:hypothetical protein NM688_g7248 [Phlebia brevispora]
MEFQVQLHVVAAYTAPSDRALNILAMPHLPDATPAILLRSEYTSIASTMGIGYLGVAFSSMSPRCKDDNGFLKLFVAIVWMLDTAQQTIVTYAFYHYLILNFGDVRALTIISWGVPTWMVFNFTASSSLVETSGLPQFAPFSELLHLVCTPHSSEATAHFDDDAGLNLAYSAKAFSIAFFDVAEEKLEPIGVYALSIGLLGDTSVAIAMTYYFYKSRTGFGRSDGMISKLIVLTVVLNMGTLHTQYLAAPFSFYDLFFNMALSKLYANTVLTVLNSRANILDTMQVFKIDSVVRKGLAERKKRESDWTILSSIHLQLPEEDLSGAV